MTSQFVASWPILPASLAVIFGVCVAAGLIIMLRDAGAFDTGRLHAFGMTLLGMGLCGLMLMGVWNMAIGFASLNTQQGVFAAAAPPSKE